jgi:hypothetical protein
MSRESARESPRLTVIYWRDIPAQVKARTGRRRVSAPLSDRFMIAVDRAATRAGKTSTDEYIAEWREETRPCGDDIQAEADSEANRIEQDYPPDLVRSYVRNGGWSPNESP